MFIESGYAFMMTEHMWHLVALTSSPPVHFGTESKSKQQFATLSLTENTGSRNQQIQNLAFFCTDFCRKISDVPSHSSSFIRAGKRSPGQSFKSTFKPFELTLMNN